MKRIADVMSEVVVCRYSTTLLAVLGAVATVVLVQMLGAYPAMYLLLVLPIAASALLGRLGAGLLATAAVTVCTKLMLRPRLAPGFADDLSLIALVVVGAMLTAVIEGFYRAWHRAQNSQRESEAQFRELAESIHEVKLESLGVLAGGVAHDFNNVLAVIGANVELLGDGRKTADAAEIVQEVKQAVTRAAALARQLLAFSRKQVTQAETAPRASAKGIETILFVDDDLHVCASASRALRAQGYEVVEASDGDAALKALRDRPVDHLITDVA